MTRTSELRLQELTHIGHSVGTGSMRPRTGSFWFEIIKISSVAFYTLLRVCSRRGSGASTGSMSASAGALTPRTPGAVADDSMGLDSPMMASPAVLQFGGVSDDVNHDASGGDAM